MVKMAAGGGAACRQQILTAAAALHFFIKVSAPCLFAPALRFIFA